MLDLVVRIAVRLVLCSLATWLLWQGVGLGAVALAMTAPLFAVALARPLIDAFGLAWGATNERALRHRSGRHFEHRGQALDVAEDDDGLRWLLLADVRKVLPGLPRDEVVRRQSGALVGTVDGYAGLRIRADALQDLLRKASEPAAVKFKVWLERDVLSPTGAGPTARLSEPPPEKATKL